jgi:hypothetical protein
LQAGSPGWRERLAGERERLARVPDNRTSAVMRRGRYGEISRSAGFSRLVRASGSAHRIRRQGAMTGKSCEQAVQMTGQLE